VLSDRRWNTGGYCKNELTPEVEAQIREIVREELAAQHLDVTRATIKVVNKEQQNSGKVTKRCW
jgi:hypothetical protein